MGTAHKRRILRGIIQAGLILFIAAILVGCLEVSLGYLLPEPGLPKEGITGPPLWDVYVAQYDYDVCYAANSLTLRDNEIPPKSPGTYRILAIGDSYTYGWGVPLEYAWCKVLEANLRRRGLDVEVINVGVPGVGPVEYARHARIAMNLLEPDMLLVELLEGNDLRQTPFRLWTLLFPNIMRLATEGREIWGPLTLPVPEQRLSQPTEGHRQFLISCAEEMHGELSPEALARFDALDEEVKTLFWEGLLNPWMITSHVRDGDVFREVLDLENEYRPHLHALKWLLRRMARHATQGGAQMAVLSLPNGIYDNRHLVKRLRRLGAIVPDEVMFADEPVQAAQAAADFAGIPCITATTAFRERADDPDIYFKMDHHWTAKGHALFADAIAPHVEALVRHDLSAQAP